MIMKMSTSIKNKNIISDSTKPSTPTGYKIVQNKFIWRPTSSILPKQNKNEQIPVFSNLALNEEVSNNQHDARTYRILLHAFAQNINKYYGKNHKKVLGELEEMYKIPLTKEQKLQMEQNIAKIYNKHIDKFMREMLQRNSHIVKTREQYQSIHPQKYISEPFQAKQNPQKVVQNKRKNFQRPISSGTKRRQSYAQNSTGKKQLTVPNTNNINQTQNKSKIDTNFENFKLQEKEYLQISDKLKHNAYHNNRHIHLLLKTNKKSEIQYDRQIFMNKKDTFSRKISTSCISNNQNNTQNYEYIIQQLNGKEKSQQYPDSYRQNSIKYSYSRYHQNKLKYSSYRNKDDNEKSKLHQKILTMNTESCLLIQPKSQGYKAKSKCWGTKTKTKSFSINQKASMGHTKYSQYKAIRTQQFWKKGSNNQYF